MERSIRWGWTCRWRRSWAGCRDIDIALTTGSRATGAVAEVLSSERVVSLHSGCGRCVAVTHCAVDHVKAWLSLVQPQLEAGTAAPGKYCARHSMLKMRLGAVPLTDVKMPNPLLTKYRSSQYGKIV